MPYRLDWLIADRVQLWEFTGDVTLNDIGGAMQSAQPNFQQTERPIHMVVDLNAVNQFLFDLSALKPYRMADIDKWRGWIVYVREVRDAQIQLLVDSLAQIRNTQHKWFDTRDEALKFLHHMDFTLDDKG